MSSLSSCKRRLKPQSVYLAEKVAIEKLRLARQAVLDRAEKDVEFAADVLKAVGENLPPQIKEACEKTLADAKTKALAEKWNKTGLLDGIKTDVSKCNPALLIEGQEKIPICNG